MYHTKARGRQIAHLKTSILATLGKQTNELFCFKDSTLESYPLVLTVTSFVTRNWKQLKVCHCKNNCCLCYLYHRIPCVALNKTIKIQYQGRVGKAMWPLGLQGTDSYIKENGAEWRNRCSSLTLKEV